MVSPVLAVEESLGIEAAHPDGVSEDDRGTSTRNNPLCPIIRARVYFLQEMGGTLIQS